MEAARYVPTASSRRQVLMTVTNDPEKLWQTGEHTIGLFDSAAKKPMNPFTRLFKPFFHEACSTLLMLLRLKEQYRASHDPILHKATALLFFHTPPSCRFGCEDASLANQNALLMAQSPGVSQIVMGDIIRTIRNDGVFPQITGIDGKIQAIMAPGIPAFH